MANLHAAYTHERSEMRVLILTTANEPQENEEKCRSSVLPLLGEPDRYYRDAEDHGAMYEWTSLGTRRSIFRLARRREPAESWRWVRTPAGARGPRPRPALALARKSPSHSGRLCLTLRGARRLTNPMDSPIRGPRVTGNMNPHIP